MRSRSKAGSRGLRGADPCGSPSLLDRGRASRAAGGKRPATTRGPDTRFIDRSSDTPWGFLAHRTARSRASSAGFESLSKTGARRRSLAEVARSEDEAASEGVEERGSCELREARVGGDPVGAFPRFDPARHAPGGGVDASEG